MDVERWLPKVTQAFERAHPVVMYLVDGEVVEFGSWSRGVTLGDGTSQAHILEFEHELGRRVWTAFGHDFRVWTPRAMGGRT